MLLFKYLIYVWHNFYIFVTQIGSSFQIYFCLEFLKDYIIVNFILFPGLGFFAIKKAQVPRKICFSFFILWPCWIKSKEYKFSIFVLVIFLGITQKLVCTGCLCSHPMFFFLFIFFSLVNQEVQCLTPISALMAMSFLVPPSTIQRIM